MNNSHKITWLAILLAASVFSSQALAKGKGFYFHLGSGSADWTAEDDYDKWTFESDTTHTGFGFVLDTATAEDRLFNYRFQVGYERYTDEIKNSTSKLDFDSLVIDQDFGFGVVRTDTLRFWLGPELRISLSGESSDNYDTALVGVGLGPVLGINFHTGPRVSLALKSGFLRMTYNGTADDTTSNNNDISYDVDENIAFFSFAVLFR